MNRRGFLSGLIAAVAAPAVVKAEILMPLRGLVMPVRSPVPIFQDGDLLYDGVIVRHVKLSEFAKEITREFIRDNLFSPYLNGGPIVPRESLLAG